MLKPRDYANPFVFIFSINLFVFLLAVPSPAAVKQFEYKTAAFSHRGDGDSVSVFWTGDVVSNCTDYETKNVTLFFALLNEQGYCLEMQEIDTIKLARLEKVGLDISLEVDPGVWNTTYSVDLFFCEVNDEACKTNLPQLASYIEPVTGMEFVLVKGGSFMLGGVEGAKSFEGSKEIVLEDFYIGKYEVTQAQWKKLMGDNPSLFKGENNPVEKVSWNQVQEFINRLNAASGEQYRLPSESEWEYAARSGGKQHIWAGTSNFEKVENYAWDSETSNASTHPVGEKLPNGLGLYDMSGNVWEWCQSIYTNKRGADIQKPDKGGAGFPRVIKGGSWFSTRRFEATTFRIYSWPSISTEYLGFRLVRPLNLETEIATE